jgi:hypothetical protein
MTNHFYTVGHSTRDFDEMSAMLQNSEITHSVDVRSFPSSRKFPQWNQSAIIGAPPQYRIRVDPEIGRQATHPQGRAERDEFKEGLNELLELGEHGRTAIMCSEAVL